jgi:hypothetical protein
MVLFYVLFTKEFQQSVNTCHYLEYNGIVLASSACVLIYDPPLLTNAAEFLLGNS